jgi:hypothetical protein
LVPYDGSAGIASASARFQPPDDARVTPQITSRPPISWTRPRRSPKVSTAITVVKTGMRFRKTDPQDAPIDQLCKKDR